MKNLLIGENLIFALHFCLEQIEKEKKNVNGFLDLRQTISNLLMMINSVLTPFLWLKSRPDKEIKSCTFQVL